MGCFFWDWFKRARSIFELLPSISSMRFTLKSRWCSHMIILTRILLGRITVSFYRRNQISIWSIKLFISLSVDEILLLRDVKCFTNFRWFLSFRELGFIVFIVMFTNVSADASFGECFLSNPKDYTEFRTVPII